MPISITPNPTSNPPRLEVTISTADGSTMTAVSLTRTAGGITTPTRVQPTSGFASRYIEDNEPPWDVPVVYTATITYNGGSSNEVAVATAVTLTPAPLAFWGIHPTVPSLSMPLDVADPSAAGVATLGDVVYAAQATQHRVLGSKLPTVTKIGTRSAPATQIELTTVSDAERIAVGRLLDDETPILLRAPAAWGWGWEDGYYAVGDLRYGRQVQNQDDDYRTVTLPVQRVTPPAGAQASSWSWGGVLAGYPDWPTIAARYADWNAVAANRPS